MNKLTNLPKTYHCVQRLLLYLGMLTGGPRLLYRENPEHNQ